MAFAEASQVVPAAPATLAVAIKGLVSHADAT